MYKTLLFYISISLPILAFSEPHVGFKSGNEMVSNYIYGNIHAYCPGTSRFHTCRMDYLEPGDRDKFVHPAIDADKVELIANHQQGSQTKKKSKFDAVQGQSKKYINLWLGSLLQRPLLRKGTNRIEYKLTKNGNMVKSGTFTATVQEAPAKRCRDRVYHFHRDNDCQNLSFLCQRYFSEQGYCQ